MVHESYPWKQDLRRRKNLLLRYNKADRFDANYDATYTVIEKAIFYSAFIIRKLIDCDRLSTEADDWQVQIEKYSALKEFDRIHHFVDEDSHDWENGQGLTVPAKNICNWLIHSYVFTLMFKDGTVDAFAVASDFDRNDSLYVIELAEWIRYMEFVASDYVVARYARAEEVKLKKDKFAWDYISKYKERG